MCVPCGNRYPAKSRSIKTKISKKEVQDVITCGEYETCKIRMTQDEKYREYDGCTQNLLEILNDSQTTVCVANMAREEYKRGYRTILMDAPGFATVIFRIEK